MAYNLNELKSAISCDFSALSEQVNNLRPSMSEGYYTIIGVEQINTPQRQSVAFATSTGNYIGLPQFERTPEVISALKVAVKGNEPFRVHVKVVGAEREIDGIVRRPARFVVDKIIL